MEYFRSRRFLVIDEEKCVGCDLCFKICPISGVLLPSENGHIVIAQRLLCAGCAKCVERCPSRAIQLKIYESE
jgi:Na+-translocating ferredoxin:NAD+ oxidoreductase RNF subunit RnfB